LNYKRKNNIYNTHYYIITHLVEHERCRTRTSLGGGPIVANQALCQASGSSQSIEYAKALGGAWVFPNVSWRSGCHGQSGLAKTQAPGGARVSPWRVNP
jgi:hypothetical protein